MYIYVDIILSLPFRKEGMEVKIIEARDIKLLERYSARGPLSHPSHFYRLFLQILVFARCTILFKCLGLSSRRASGICVIRMEVEVLIEAFFPVL